MFLFCTFTLLFLFVNWTLLWDLQVIYTGRAMGLSLLGFIKLGRNLGRREQNIFLPHWQLWSAEVLWPAPPPPYSQHWPYPWPCAPLCERWWSNLIIYVPPVHIYFCFLVAWTATLNLLLFPDSVAFGFLQCITLGSGDSFQLVKVLYHLNHY